MHSLWRECTRRRNLGSVEGKAVFAVAGLLVADDEIPVGLDLLQLFESVAVTATALEIAVFKVQHIQRFAVGFQHRVIGAFEGITVTSRQK